MRIYLDHLPWAFQVEDLADAQVEYFVRGVFENGLRSLTPLDCDRIVAYAALEGCPEAKADIAEKFCIMI